MTAEAFDWGPPISVYTRAQAIEDGLLVAVPADLAAGEGYRIPVAFGASVHGILSAREGDYTAKLRDVLMMARIYSMPARKRGDEGPHAFPVIVDGRTHHMQLHFSPVEGFTILLRGED